MINRLPLLGSSVLLLLGSSLPGSAQYYYGPAYGPPAYGPPPAYAPPPAYGPYNAPPPPGREYGRGYQGDEFAPPRAPRPLSARAVIDRLEDMGYEDVGRPRFTGTLYVVQATGPGGVRQQIVVDAIRGVILNRTVAPAPDYPAGGPQGRRYGGHPLDTDGLSREPTEVTPRRAPPRREAARPARVESEPRPSAQPAPEGDALPAPADPRLAPSAEPSPRTSAPRPFEGRSAPKQANRGESRPETPPKESGARPFGLNPVTPDPKPAAAEPRKAAQPAAPAKKPVAEARPMPDKPVRVIQGVTPLASGESRSQAEGAPAPTPD